MVSKHVPLQELASWFKVQRMRGKYFSPNLERWEQLSSEESYMLGEPMYFKAYAAFVPKDESVFVDSCFVTTSKDPNTTPRHEVIHNFG